MESARGRAPREVDRTSAALSPVSPARKRQAHSSRRRNQAELPIRLGIKFKEGGWSTRSHWRRTERHEPERQLELSRHLPVWVSNSKLTDSRMRYSSARTSWTARAECNNVVRLAPVKNWQQEPPKGRSESGQAAGVWDTLHSAV